MYIFLMACGVGELPQLFCSSIYQWTCYKYHSHFSPDKSRHRSEVQAIWETTLHHGTGVDYYTHAEPIFSIHRPMWISSRKPIRHAAITKLTPTNFSKTPQHDQKHWKSNKEGLISTQMPPCKHNKDLSCLQWLSPGMWVNTRYVTSTRGTSWCLLSVN